LTLGHLAASLEGRSASLGRPVASQGSRSANLGSLPAILQGLPILGSLPASLENLVSLRNLLVSLRNRLVNLRNRLASLGHPLASLGNRLASLGSEGRRGWRRPLCFGLFRLAGASYLPGASPPLLAEATTRFPLETAMKFTLDVSARLHGLFRLKTDGTFRQMGESIGLQAGDQTFPTVEAVYHRIDQLKSPLSLGGKAVPLPDPEQGRGFMDLLADPCVRVHRDKIPSAPTLTDVRAAIAAGDDDERPIVLILELDGRVKLVPFADDLVCQPKCAVRIEAFTAQGYTGIEAARDDSHVKGCLRVLLEGWIAHLRSGKVGIYWDVSTKSEGKLREEIAEVALKGYSPTNS